jgi:hypothetical protein
MDSLGKRVREILDRPDGAPGVTAGGETASGAVE